MPSAAPAGTALFLKRWLRQPLSMGAVMPSGPLLTRALALTAVREMQGRDGHDPRLVVLDEPTAGVDPAGSREIRDLIMDLKRRGITVLLSSHLLAQAQEICDRIGILADGVLVREGRLQELIAIENQTELVIAGASDDLVQEIESFIGRSNAKLIERRKSTTTLERLFLESTGGNDKSSTRE